MGKVIRNGILSAFCTCLLLGPLVSPLSAQTLDDSPAVSISKATRMIAQAEKGVAEPEGWATDIFDALRAHGLPVSIENVCSTIAIIDQESGFRADPPVPGLGAISEKAIREKLSIPIVGRVALNFLENNPTPETSFMKRIRAAKTERDLDLAYRALLQDASKRASLDLVMRSGLFNKLIEDKNEIDTIGSMQVSVKFAIDLTRRGRWLPMTLTDVYAVRDRLYTREGGVYFGVAQLLDYKTPYSSKIHRFADYNAGRYASRNAAFQTMLGKMTDLPLARDGDLLAYGKSGSVLSAVTSTEQAMRKANMLYKFGLSDKQIRDDFLLEKKLEFDQSKTYLALTSRFQRKTGSDAFIAVVPQIELASLKFQGFTTERFAKNVYKRYQSCLKAKI
jgi:hypothetical protein